MFGWIDQLAQGHAPPWINLIPAGTAPVTLSGLSLAGPSIRHEGLELIDRMTGYCDASASASIAEAELHIPEALIEEKRSGLGELQTAGRQILNVPGETFYLLFFERLAYRRLAATVFAIRLFETETGRRPERLGELVPDYLPFVPLDPLAPDNRPLTYVPDIDGSIYSFGRNRVDDGGARGIGFIELTMPFTYEPDYRELEHFPSLLESGDE